MRDTYWELACRQQGGATLINHRHSNQDSYEIIEVLSGEGTVFIMDRTYPFAPGTLILIDAACLHCITPDDIAGYNRNKLIIDKQYLHGVFDAIGARETLDGFFGPNAGSCYYLTAEQARQADRLFCDMEQTDDAWRSLRVVAGLTGMLTMCLRSTGPAEPRADDKLAPALTYIRLHYSEPLTVEQIAAGAHMSKFHLCRLFRRQTGLTIMQYLNEQRLSEARRQLLDTDMSISAVAQNCGFGSSSHFCTLFKRREGMSPREYRQRK